MADEVTFAQVAGASVAARCRRCGGGFYLPARARFCPMCGIELTDAHWLPESPEDRSGCGNAGNRESSASPIHSPDDADPDPISLVITGYANALYNLGSRYEHGRGALRNPSEAARCYMKAAKLGNPDAHLRVCLPDQPVNQQSNHFPDPR